MKRNPEWLDSHSAIPSPCRLAVSVFLKSLLIRSPLDYSANYEPIQRFELYLRQQADRLRLPDSQSRNNEDIPDISGQDQVDYLPTRHFGEASDRPLGNIALSNTRPQLGQSDHPQYAADVGNGPVSPTRALLDTCEDLPLPLAHAGDKKVKRFHFSEITGRLPYVRATVTIQLCKILRFLAAELLMRSSAGQIRATYPHPRYHPPCRR
jgi:hypothetical protein